MRELPEEERLLLLRLPDMAIQEVLEARKTSAPNLLQRDNASLFEFLRASIPQAEVEEPLLQDSGENSLPITPNNP